MRNNAFHPANDPDIVNIAGLSGIRAGWFAYYQGGDNGPDKVNIVGLSGVRARCFAHYQDIDFYHQMATAAERSLPQFWVFANRPT